MAVALIGLKSSFARKSAGQIAVVLITQKSSDDSDQSSMVYSMFLCMKFWQSAAKSHGGYHLPPSGWDPTGKGAPLTGKGGLGHTRATPHENAMYAIV